MCIFSRVSVVESTQIFVGMLSNTRRLMAYSNTVTVEGGDSVMMLPVPSTGEVILHDTTPYKHFLVKISEAVARHANRRNRGTLGVDNPKGFKKVGVYQMLVVRPDDVIKTLEELGQPIPDWMDGMLASYEGECNWLFVIIPPGIATSYQPILVEFEQTVATDRLFYPMMDVHGDEPVEKMVDRRHVISWGLPISSPKTEDYIDIDVPGFPWDGQFIYSGVQFGDTRPIKLPNGDGWFNPTTSVFPFVDFKIYTDYKFE